MAADVQTSTPNRAPPENTLLRPPPLARMLDTAPSWSLGPRDRMFPIKKKPDHVPAVQRWSALWPSDKVTMGLFGIQARDGDDIASSEFMKWISSSFALPNGPSTVDHARYTDAAGMLNRVVTGYFLQSGQYASWASQAAVADWWSAPERLRDTVGVYREIITAPTDRIETIYWPDFPGGAMRDESVMIYPTPYCGYYGAMRDRLPVSAHDDLSATATATAQLRESLGARWHVRVPANVAVIRSSHTWSAMDDQQLADYTAKLAPPLERGMAYLETRQEGSLSLRNHITTTEHGEQVPEMHATGMFIDLGHMEGWAEGHKSHAAIFSAAVARYKHYGQRNQLRTWHEVYILPEGNTFEYVNCHGDTGLLPYFEAEKL